MARPATYKPEYSRVAQKMTRLGATDVEVAEAVGINIRTLYRWRASNKEFCHALKIGKVEADDRVENSLYTRATGYTHEETHVSNFQGVITLTPLVKHYPPDATSMIFWLKNRRPEQWRDKQDHELSGTVEISSIERVIVRE